MPKAKNKLSQKEQSEQFEKAAAELVEAGELDLIEAEESLNRLMDNVRQKID